MRRRQPPSRAAEARGFVSGDLGWSLAGVANCMGTGQHKPCHRRCHCVGGGRGSYFTVNPWEKKFLLSSPELK